MLDVQIGIRRTARGGLAVLALLALVALFVSRDAGAEKPVTVQVGGGTQVELNAGLSPNDFSKLSSSPAKLTLEGRIRMADGSQPPSVKELIYEFDGNGSIDVSGLPVCSLALLRENSPGRVCQGALVGAGSASFELGAGSIGSSLPIGDVQIFNGGRRNGITHLLLHTSVPGAMPFVAAAQIKIRTVDRGRFGTRAAISIPEVAGGSGALSSFSLTIGKMFVSGGRGRDLLSFKCADGKAVAHAEAIFASGTAEADLTRTCKGRSPHR